MGCLETYAAIPNLLQGTPFRSWQEVIDQYDAEPLAAQLVEQEADYLAAGVANLTNVISVDTVLLAGDLLYGVSLLAPILEEKINRRTMRRGILPVRVLPSYSGPDSHVQAAADVAFGRFLMA